MNNYKHLNNSYTVKSGSFNIDTKGFCDEFSEIKKELIEQTSEKTVIYSKYPNGFEILTIQTPDNIELKTNFPLEETTSGEYKVKFDS